MSKARTARDTIEGIARKNSVSVEAVDAFYRSMCKSGGGMAQFSHADFGGMAQWTPTMSMVGDMFNSGLKSKLDAVGRELAAFIQRDPGATEGETTHGEDGDPTADEGGRWPASLGEPSSSGSQNDMHYAVFANKHRLAIRDGGKMTIYDTGAHQISGFSQSQSTVQNLTFTSQNGVVALSELKVVGA